ncbi:hypothetical protein EON64_16850 [archaeon]|nr:MAG: hypothetical protein EON64_16850 [archaeon]
MKSFVLLCIFYVIFSLLVIGDVASSHDAAHGHVNKSEKDHLPALSRSDNAPMSVTKTQTSRLLDGVLQSVQSMIRTLLQALRRLFFLDAPKRANTSMSAPQAILPSPVEPVTSTHADAASGSVAVRGELGWAGRPATSQERQQVAELQGLLAEIVQADKLSQWLRSGVQDAEVLRFLRARQGSVPLALKMLLAHDKWRVTPYGAEAPFVHQAFNNSPLVQEIFWLGPDKLGCPTLVIRTQLHDGAYYNDDPRIYTR